MTSTTAPPDATVVRRLRWPAVAGRTAADRALAERSGLVVTALFYAIVVAVLAGLWRAAAGAGGGSLVGYSAAAITWYIAATEAATVALNVRMIADIGEDVASGAVAVELLRPASVVGVRLASGVGWALPRLALCVATGIVLCVVTVGAPPSWTGALLAVPSLVLAIGCNIAAQHAFAAAAFWLRDAGSAWFLYQKLVFVVGGMLLPLEVLPDGLQTVARWLPFQAMAYAPARLAAGHVEPMLLVVQVAWLTVLTAAAVAAFAAGERRLQVVGG